MSRPPFALTDDQARVLANKVPDLQIRFPHVPSVSHRPFVRAFIALVHEATGNLYGAGTYRRLLQAYAPERTPSTVTLADERRKLEEKLALAQRARPAVTDDQGSNLAHLIRVAINDAMDDSNGMETYVRSMKAAVQAEFLRQRLDESEAALVQMRAQRTELREHWAAAKQTADERTQMSQWLELLLARQTEINAQMTIELREMRTFAMLAIDEARGETRIWKERVAMLEKERAADARLLETFRHAAYRKGAEIPPALREGGP